MPPEATAVEAGTTPGSVRAALLAPTMATLPGRAVFALDPASPSWRGGAAGWRIRVSLRAWWATWRARWTSAMKFDLRLALAHWHGEPDGTALVTLDGLVLKFTLRQLWLLVACPAGEAPHEAPLVDLKSLANLILASQVDPTLPPWGCPHTCPSAGNTPLHVGGEPRLRSVAADSGA